jgi:hypothetical protein
MLMSIDTTTLESMLRSLDRQYLSPRDDDVRKQRERAETLIEKIHAGPEEIFQIKEFVHHGSLSRGTGLRGFDDWDCIIILDANALRTQRGTHRTPSNTITLLASAVARRHAGMVDGIGNMVIRPQDHSVGVIYPKTKFKIDLVPGIRTRGKLRIPERDTKQWIVTYPDDARARIREASIAAPDTIPAVRLLKSWSRARNKRRCALPSFAIETYVVDCMLYDGPRLDELVFGFIDRLAEAPTRSPLALLGRARPGAAVTLVDPLSRNNLTAKLTADQRSTLIKTARVSAKNVQRLRKAIARGDNSEAQRLARDLFVGRAR